MTIVLFCSKISLRFFMRFLTAIKCIIVLIYFCDHVIILFIIITYLRGISRKYPRISLIIIPTYLQAYGRDGS